MAMKKMIVYEGQQPTKEQIAEKIKHLDKPNVSMPPWCGTDEETDQLAEYLVSIQRKENAN